MKTIIIKTKDGQKYEINPVVDIVIDNSFHLYTFTGEEIESIELE